MTLYYPRYQIGRASIGDRPRVDTIDTDAHDLRLIDLLGVPQDSRNPRVATAQPVILEGHIEGREVVVEPPPSDWVEAVLLNEGQPQTYHEVMELLLRNAYSGNGLAPLFRDHASRMIRSASATANFGSSTGVSGTTTGV